MELRIGKISLHHELKNAIFPKIFPKILQAKACVQKNNAKSAWLLARLGGIEPTTLGFGGQYSIH
jgi:hypothetical protein